MNRSVLRRLMAAVLVNAMVSPAFADYTVHCASSGYKYTTCRLSEPGYITVERQKSSAACTKGRSWDYNRREIWVDDGCSADFRVQTQDNHKKDAAVAAGVVVGAALLGALLSNKDVVDDHKYRDENYYGSRHTSYVPSWMVGTFTGYNPLYGANVSMIVTADGQVSANAGGQIVKGYINDERLHVGNVVFAIDQTREGFMTSQVGDRHNEVRYRRVQ